MIFLNYEFFAFIYLIVYIGAISIFFLFAVILLDLKYEETPHFFSFWTILHLIYFILFTIVYLYYYTQIFLPIKIEFIFDNNIFKNNYFENIFLFTNSNLEIQNIPMVTDVISIGSTIYFEYAIFIIVSGIILFIALFAIILLTFEVINKYFKYQEIISQLNVKNNIIITE
jgi:NADH:ubiquinone oxidoreductase subunit 6 (subunit J)